MSDLQAAGGRIHGSARAQATGSPTIRGPRDIMRERNAREARRKAEQEALERARAEEEARLLQEEKRKSVERRAAAAGVGAPPSSAPLRGSQDTTQRISDASQRSDRRAERTSGGDANVRPSDAAMQGRTTSGRAGGGGDARRRPTQSSAEAQAIPPQPRPADRVPESYPGTGMPQTQIPHQVPSALPTQEAPPQNRSSFPHAFERWETLSAHWEGLTSFWIRRLEEHANEIGRDPLSAQLARQNTDLSAAGANLFHAVVELQRLRASSERKFQRWFFDTRAEAERAQEVQAITENALREERMIRDQMIAQAVEQALAQQQPLAPPPDPNAEKRLSEMRRELDISKQEARRAWDELGRREAEERARTLSLRDGQPTLVGGVQVVPMMQGVPSQRGSGGHPAPAAAMDEHVDNAYMDNSEGPQLGDAYQQYQQSRAEVQDAFVETSGEHGHRHGADTRSTPSTTHSPPYTPLLAPAVQQPGTSNAFYQQQQDTLLHPSSAPPPASEAYSDEEYEIDPQGHFRRDSRGHKIPYQGPISEEESDEDDEDDATAAATREREMAYMQRYGPPVHVSHAPTSSSAPHAPPAPTSHPMSSPSDEPDYEGEGYGSGAGWEGVPRHHHPTRLSDVLEEDENSRTSASQAGRV